MPKAPSGRTGGGGPRATTPSRVRCIRLVLAASLLGIAPVFVALPGAAAPPSGPIPSETVASGELDVVLDSTQHWLGTNDVLLSVYDRSGASLAGRATPIHVILTAPDGSVLEAEPALERFATYGRSLYRARVPLQQLGRWGLGVHAEIDGVWHQGSTVLDVSTDEGTPPLGSIVPGGATPTMRDANSLMHHISSDPEPLTAFYTWSLDEALAQHQPVVFVLDSYAFRPNAACGGVLGILHEVFIDYPGLVVVHAEPWQMAPGPDGMLELDPPGGPAVLTDTARAWGVDEPPWVFVIDTERSAAGQVPGRRWQRRAARRDRVGHDLAPGCLSPEAVGAGSRGRFADPQLCLCLGDARQDAFTELVQAGTDRVRRRADGGQPGLQGPQSIELAGDPTERRPDGVRVDGGLRAADGADREEPRQPEGRLQRGRSPGREDRWRSRRRPCARRRARCRPARARC